MQTQFLSLGKSLCSCFVPGTTLGPGSTVGNKTKQSPLHCGLHPSGEADTQPWTQKTLQSSNKY